MQAARQYTKLSENKSKPSSGNRAIKPSMRLNKQDVTLTKPSVQNPIQASRIRTPKKEPPKQENTSKLKRELTKTTDPSAKRCDTVLYLVFHKPRSEMKLGAPYSPMNTKKLGRSAKMCTAMSTLSTVRRRERSLGLRRRVLSGVAGFRPGSMGVPSLPLSFVHTHSPRIGSMHFASFCRHWWPIWMRSINRRYISGRS